MTKKKILFISQEISPYLPDSKLGLISRLLPQYCLEDESDVRVFMPRFGSVNSRKHRLHEVIRLSGMNIILDSTDHPLIIKVASIQQVRMQVYFIESDDYFQRKNTYADDDEILFADNDERAIFFARSVLETVKKLRWSPDIVHCHGWLTSVVPLYLKKAYKEDPIFNNTKIITSLYSNPNKGELNERFGKKIVIDGVAKEDIEIIENNPTYLSLQKLAINMSDSVILADDDIDNELLTHIKESQKPNYEIFDTENYYEKYKEIYDSM